VVKFAAENIRRVALAVEKTSVFISSRFAEFHELRRALAERLNNFPYTPIHAIELDDNGAETVAPATACINWIKRSELLVLLLGDTYGPCVQNEQISCTHLEYRAAIAADSETRVIPFFIGESISRNTQATGSDSLLDSFRREVMQNHRVGIYRRPTDDDTWKELLDTIVGWITKAIWEIRFRDLSQESDADVPDSGEIAGVSDTEIAKLESLRTERVSELALLLQAPSIESALDAAKQPRALAAAEQLSEARLALQIGERTIAEHHLREAVSLRPLDPVANEWLARVLLSRGRIKQAQEAIKLADCAARIYGKSEQALRAAAASILAARAAGQSERERGIEYARDAIQYAGWFGQAHLELARQLAQAGKSDEALGSLRRAFDCLPSSLDNVMNDPAFESMRADLREFLNDLLGRIRSMARKISGAESKIVDVLGKNSNINPDWVSDGKLSRLVYGCRRSVLRQLRLLQNQAHNCTYADVINAETASNVPMCSLDAASLTLSASRQIEITSLLVREDQTVPAGTVILKYVGAESGRIQTWVAPVPLRILRISQNITRRPVRGMESILTWTPSPQVTPRYDLTLQLNSDENSRARLLNRQTNLSKRHANTLAMQRVAGGFGCLLLLSAWLMHTGPFVQVLQIIGGLACAWYSVREWKGLRKLRSNIDNCNSELNATGQRIERIKSELQAIAEFSQEISRRLTSAIAHWEAETISLFGATMPFPGLRSAQKGDWVVIAPKTIERYGQDIGLNVAFSSNNKIDVESSLSVYRVVYRSATSVELDRDAVFFPSQRL
jgi:tetratricopeptide (TPR) repeat protein